MVRYVTLGGLAVLALAGGLVVAAMVIAGQSVRSMPRQTTAHVNEGLNRQASDARESLRRENYLEALGQARMLEERSWSKSEGWVSPEAKGITATLQSDLDGWLRIHYRVTTPLECAILSSVLEGFPEYATPNTSRLASLRVEQNKVNLTLVRPPEEPLHAQAAPSPNEQPGPRRGHLDYALAGSSTMPPLQEAPPTAGSTPPAGEKPRADPFEQEALKLAQRVIHKFPEIDIASIDWLSAPDGEQCRPSVTLTRDQID
jgi:hypothetical protein